MSLLCLVLIKYAMKQSSEAYSNRQHFSIYRAYGINKVDKGPKEVLNPEIQKVGVSPFFFSVYPESFLVLVLSTLRRLYKKKGKD